MMNDQQTEAEAIIEQLYEQHKDVLTPLIDRLNECTIKHDGDSMFFLWNNLSTLAEAIKEMLAKGTIIPAPAPGAKNKAGMN